MLPFGPKNAPALFQQLMWKILGDLPYVFVYLDDILVAAESIDEHAEQLRVVLSRLRNYNLFLNVKKCVFGEKRIHHLGHIIGEGEIRPDPRRSLLCRTRPSRGT